MELGVMIEASCHCGAVHLEIEAAPETVTDWKKLDPSIDRMGVNARLMDPAVLAAARVRRLDGADTKEYLD